MLMIRLLKHLGVLLPMLGDASEEVGTSKPFNEYRSYICVLYVSRPLILGAYFGISFELNIPFLPQKISFFFHSNHHLAQKKKKKHRGLR